MMLMLISAVVLSLRTISGEPISSEGTSFALAIYPSDGNFFDTELSITTRLENKVRLTFPNLTDDALDGPFTTFTEEFELAADSTLRYDVSAVYRVIKGVQRKAIYVDSDKLITIHMASTVYAARCTADASLIRPVGNHTMYFLASLDRTFSSYKPWSFYTIVAVEDDTEVEVYRRVDGILTQDISETIDRHEVFMQAAESHSTDYTGAYVVSSKPVSVFSGHGHVVLTNTDTTYAAVSESMPPATQLGMNYTSFPLAYGIDSTGYLIRVIAASNDTEVAIPGVGFLDTINSGEFIEVTYGSSRSATRVHCTKPCLAAQYTIRTTETGDVERGISVFMAVLTSDEELSNDVVFHTPFFMVNQNVTHGALSIVADFEPGPGDLFLNDLSLDDLEWDAADGEDDVWAAYIEVEPGNYRLYSTESGESFAAYLYTTMDSGRYSMGFPVGYGVPEPVHPEEDEDDDRNPPFHKVILLGNFTSVNGEDYTQQCMDSYTDNLRDKAASLIPSLNNMLGEELCPYIEEDNLMLISASAILKTSGPAGVTEVIYILRPENAARMSDVYLCAWDIAEYLEDFNNWGYPVIPPVAGCPHPVFEPNQFVSGSTGNDWVCPETVDRLEDSQVSEVPGYSINVYDNYTTFLGQDLSPSCTDRYGNDWLFKTLSMVPVINDKMDQGEVCAGQAGQISALSATSSFTSQGSEGSVSASFYLMPTDHDMSFQEVYTCADDVFVFLKDHNNWGSLPLLPPAPGCPLLLFDPPVFYYAGESWECLN